MCRRWLLLGEQRWLVGQLPHSSSLRLEYLHGFVLRVLHSHVVVLGTTQLVTGSISLIVGDVLWLSLNELTKMFEQWCGLRLN